MYSATAPGPELIDLLLELHPASGGLSQRPQAEDDAGTFGLPAHPGGTRPLPDQGLAGMLRGIEEVDQLVPGMLLGELPIGRGVVGHPGVAGVGIRLLGAGDLADPDRTAVGIEAPQRIFGDATPHRVGHLRNRSLHLQQAHDEQYSIWPTEREANWMLLLGAGQTVAVDRTIVAGLRSGSQSRSTRTRRPPGLSPVPSLSRSATGAIPARRSKMINQPVLRPRPAR